MRYVIRTICAAVFVVLLLPVLAHAQQEIDSISAAGLTVSPAIMEIAGKPGETVKKQFYIQNISSSAMPVTAALDRLRPNEPEIDLSLSESFNAAQWVKIDEPHHILDVKERRKITATITVPKDAEPGGHYATVVWQPLVPETTASGSTAKIAPQVGVLVFITVPGDAKYNIGLKNNVSRLQWSKNIDMNAEFANTGTIHILPTAKVVIKNILGHTKAEMPQEPHIVLPNTTRQFPAAWNKSALFGIYTIETTATYGPGQTAITSGKKYIVVIQWLPLLFLMPLVLAATILTLKTHKRWPRAWRAFKGKHYVHRLLKPAPKNLFRPTNKLKKLFRNPKN